MSGFISRSVQIAVMIIFLAPVIGTRIEAAEQGNPTRGANVFSRACVACHSLEPDRSMTGPSLAMVWNRKAGTLASFVRYSSALKASGIVWNEDTLDHWLKDPRNFITGNSMTFIGIQDAQARSDLIAFLKEVTRPGASPPSETRAQQGSMDGMMGGGQQAPNLKKLGPDDRVTAITYCRDTYRVTTGDGEVHDFWERNLRFKTDSSGDGPEKGAPALVGAGMMGDRASVIFSDPDEISRSIKREC